SAGSGQSSEVGTAFAAPLQALVTRNGSPVSGATVKFTAPGSDASGTFASGTAIDTATTDASGIATSSVFTANTLPGAYVVTATPRPGAWGGTAPPADATVPASFSLTNTTKASQVVFIQQPTNGTATTIISPALTVQLADRFGNKIATSGVEVTVALGNNPTT